jgi:molybdenum cofactor synthesis domain-containing protein
MQKDSSAKIQSPCSARTVPVDEAVGMVLAHDVTEMRKDEFKGQAFRKGHVVRQEDIEKLRRIGKEYLYALELTADEMHEDDAALALARALMGEGVALSGGPREGKVMLIADRDGLLLIDTEALFEVNLHGDVLCSSLHTNTVVNRGRVLAGAKAVPLVLKRAVIDQAVAIADRARTRGAGGVIAVKEMRRPRAGVVITGREVFEGRIKDSFAPLIRRKIEDLGGEIVATHFAPDDKEFIRKRLEDLLAAGADLLITTGGMSVDPDDVTRFAVRDLGATDVVYGSPVLPGAMVLVGYMQKTQDRSQKSDTMRKNRSGLCSDLYTLTSDTVPIIGIPACGMYHKTTIVDLLLPRILAGEKIGRKELAELGHGGMCLACGECRYPICPFGK